MRRLKILISATAFLLAIADSSAQWTQTTGLYGQAAIIRSIASMDSVLFVGTSGAGVYRSTDGQQWKVANEGLAIRHVDALCVYGHLLFAGGEQNRIYVSADSGVSWTQCRVMHSQTQTDVAISCFGVLSSIVSNPQFFAGTNTGMIYRSEDNGTTWNVSASELNGVQCFKSAHKKFFLISALFAGTGRGVYKFTGTLGHEWTQLNHGLSDTTVYAMTATSDYIYAANNYEICRSTDMGENWTRISTLYAIDFAVWETGIFAAQSTDVYLSRDFGIHWEGTGLFANKEPCVLAVARDYLYAGTTHYGVWRRSLSQLWTTVDHERAKMPTACRLEQNSPNPFNSSTTIWFSLPIAENVSLNVYSLLGIKVAELANTKLPAGIHKAVWNAGDLPNGVYYYVLQAGVHSQVRKALILK